MTKQVIFDFIKQVYLERWDVLLLVIIIAYRRQLMIAFKGGNGVFQVDEIAKGIILFVFYASFRVEATRVDLAHPVFSDAYWFAVLGTVALIAGIKEGKFLLNGNKKEVKEQGVGQTDQPTSVPN